MFWLDAPQRMHRHDTLSDYDGNYSDDVNGLMTAADNSVCVLYVTVYDHVLRHLRTAANKMKQLCGTADRWLRYVSY